MFCTIFIFQVHRWFTMPYLLIAILYLLPCNSLSSNYQAVDNTTKEDTRIYRTDQYMKNCTSDRDCLIHSYCHLYRCVCKDGFIPDEDRGCIKVSSDLGDYCEKDDQCQAALGTHSYCRRKELTDNIGVCSCSPRSHYANKICYKTAYIGDVCEGDDNCLIRSKDIEASCHFSRCICPPDYREYDYGNDCIKISELLDACDLNANCMSPNTLCLDGFCKCQNGYKLNDKNTTCIPGKAMGDPCDSDEECQLSLSLSRCNTSCVCQEGAHLVNDACWRKAKLLEYCNHPNECQTNKFAKLGEDCINGICQCKEGFFVEDRRYCVPEDYYNADGSGSITKSSCLLASISLLFTFKAIFINA